MSKELDKIQKQSVFTFPFSAFIERNNPKCMSMIYHVQPLFHFQIMFLVHVIVTSQGLKCFVVKKLVYKSFLEEQIMDKVYFRSHMCFNCMVD